MVMVDFLNILCKIHQHVLRMVVHGLNMSSKDLVILQDINAPG